MTINTSFSSFDLWNLIASELSGFGICFIFLLVKQYVGNSRPIS